MGTKGKKPGIGFWCTVVVVSALLLYPLSFGPACWINQRTGIGRRTMAIGYRPISWLLEEGHPAAPALFWYASLGTETGFELQWDRDDGPYWMDLSVIPTIDPPPPPPG